MKPLKFFIELACFLLIGCYFMLLFDAKAGTEVANLFIKSMAIPFGTAWIMALGCGWVFDAFYKNVKPFTIRVW